MHVSVCEYVHMDKGAPRHQRYWVPLELELQIMVVTCPVWVLETELGSSARGPEPFLQPSGIYAMEILHAIVTPGRQTLLYFINEEARSERG